MTFIGLPAFVIQERIPFAVVGSNAVIEVGGKKIRGRKYPWGIVEGKVRVIVPVFNQQYSQNFNASILKIYRCFNMLEI